MSNCIFILKSLICTIINVHVYKKQNKQIYKRYVLFSLRLLDTLYFEYQIINLLIVTCQGFVYLYWRGASEVAMLSNHQIKLIINKWINKLWTTLTQFSHETIPVSLNWCVMFNTEKYSFQSSCFLSCGFHMWK